MPKYLALLSWLAIAVVSLFVLPQCQKKSTSTSSSACNSVTSTDDSTDPFYSSQWHLDNTGSITDINLGTVWNTNRGDAMGVTVVDDGLEIAHEDLVANVSSSGNLNMWAGTSGFSSSSGDPTPSSSSLGHGTSVAGVIGARDLNGIGVRGVAPRACLSGVNLIATGGATGTQEAQAMTHNASSSAASNNSWGPTDKLGTLASSSSSWRSGIDSALSSGFNGKGSVFLWAAGNGYRPTEAGTTGFPTDDSNYDGYANYHGVMAICGLQDDGSRVGYSEKGANLLVCGFSQTTTYGTNARGITTTDLSSTKGFNTKSASTASDTSLSSIGGAFMDYTHGSYTRIFNGTSGAAPMVTGVVALMRKENSNLTWRDVRLILAETARKNDSADSDWSTNAGTSISGGAAYHINHKYGFGAIDADAAVTLSKTWTNLVAQESAFDSGTIPVSQTFNDNDGTGTSSTVTVSSTNINKIEFIEVTLSETADIRDVEVRLTNAAGTASYLAEPHSCYSSTSSTSALSSCSQTYSSWRFGTVRHLGESANQAWTLRVADKRAGNSSGGTFTSWRLVIYGRSS